MARQWPGAEKSQRHSVLAAEAARISAEFGLGATYHTRAVKGFTRGEEYGVALAAGGFMLYVVAGGIAYSVGGMYALVTVVVVGASMLAAGFVVQKRWRTGAWHWLFFYTGGAAALDERTTEPQVVRYADLESVTLSFDDDSEFLRLRRCEIRDSRGEAITETHHPKLAAEITVPVLEGRMLPGLCAALDAGQPVEFGHLVISQAGVEYRRSRIFRPWRLPLGQIRGFTVEDPGHRLSIRPERGRQRRVPLNGLRNGVLVPRVLEHVLSPEEQDDRG